MLNQTVSREPIYNNEHADRRVISSHSGLWTPQRRVSHTAGRHAHWDRISDPKHPVYHPHFDPWQDIHMPCDRSHALMTAFGPKTASQIA